MKGIILAAFVLMLVPFSVSASSCTPSSGYDLCYEHSYDSNGCVSYAQFQFTKPYGQYGYENGVYQGDVYIDAELKAGDKLYYYRAVTTGWSGGLCSKTGCTGSESYFPINSPGKITIADEDSWPYSLGLIGWDRQDCGSDYSAAWTGRAYPGDSQVFSLDYGICNEDGDCASDEVCDKVAEYSSSEYYDCVPLDCDDSDPCTIDTIDDPDPTDIGDRKCINTQRVCDDNVRTCPDGNIATCPTQCDSSSGQCSQCVPDCSGNLECYVDSECADSEYCLLIGNTCEPLDCDDSDFCTTDSAANHQCVNTQLDSCCHTNDDCESTEICKLNVCTDGCEDIPERPCQNAIWGDYPGCSWDTSECTEPWLIVILVVGGAVLVGGIAFMVWRLRKR